MDPERPIEKLLRQAAEARRAQAGAPPELHPANRRMLQGEVARKYGSAAPQKRSLFELLMPRFAWAAAVFVGLGLAASLMFPRQNATQKEMYFAKNERLTSLQVANEGRAPAAADSMQVAPAEAPALARADNLAERDKDSLSLERQREVAQRSQSFNEPAAAPQPLPKNDAAAAAGRSVGAPLYSATTSATGGSLAGEKRMEQLASNTHSAAAPPQTPVAEESLARRYGLARPAQSTPSPTAAPADAGVAASSTMKPGGETSKTELAYESLATAQPATPSSSTLKLKAAVSADEAKRSQAPIAQVRQRFVETGSLNKNIELADRSAPAKPILVSFELQQVGRDVRIVDSDGSVYSGSFQPAETFNYLDSAAAQKAPVTRSLQSSEARPERKAVPSDAKVQADISYSFKVTGTNQTLKKIVTFTGEVLATTNALSLVGPAGTVSGNRAVPPELNPLPLQNARISGKALIGTNREVEVNAISAH